MYDMVDFLKKTLILRLIQNILQVTIYFVAICFIT